MKSLAVFLPLSFILLALSSSNGGEDLAGILKEFVKNCKLGKAVSFKNLTIFPVSPAKIPNLPRILTLDEASKSDELVISEVGEGEVNKVSLQNNSKNYVFIMAGEILTGCKQDRVLKNDILLPPKSKKFIVPAYCVEARRWQWTSPRFSPAPAMASVGVRKRAEIDESQTDVWDEISSTLRTFSAKVPGEALKEIYEVPQVKGKMDGYFKALENIPRDYPEATGIIVFIGKEFLCFDIFGGNELFKNLYPKLLKSYILEALAREGEDGKASREKALGVLRELAGAEAKMGEKPPEGNLLEIETSTIKGSALIFKEGVVHLAVFQKEKKAEEIPPIFRRYR
jgi:hypothetical protein